MLFPGFGRRYHMVDIMCRTEETFVIIGKAGMNSAFQLIFDPSRERNSLRLCRTPYLLKCFFVDMQGYLWHLVGSFYGQRKEMLTIMYRMSHCICSRVFTERTVCPPSQKKFPGREILLQNADKSLLRSSNLEAGFCKSLRYNLI